MDRAPSTRSLVAALCLLTVLVAGCLGELPRSGQACPADPTAEAGPQGEVSLTWRPVEDAERYLILRAEPGADPTLVANVSAANTSYTDATADPGETYRYTVHSWDGTARSTGCPTTEVTTVPFFPNLAAALAAGAAVALGALALGRRG